MPAERESNSNAMRSARAKALNTVSAWFGSLVMELTRNAYFNGQLIRLDGAIRMPPK